MMKTNVNVIPMEENKFKGAVTEAVFDYSGKLIELQYDGNVVYAPIDGINRISKNLINFHEASHKINKGKKEFSNDKLYYINIAREIGLDKTIKAMEEELRLRKIGKMTYETYCLKSLKKMTRRCK